MPFVSYYQKNKATILKRSAIYRAKKRAELAAQGREYYEAHKEQVKAKNRRYRKEIKRKAFAALGGVCAHCGYTIECALQIDHVNGGGNQDHPKRGEKYYRNVIKSVEAEEHKYQLLCANCNWIKRCDLGETH